MITVITKIIIHYYFYNLIKNFEKLNNLKLKKLFCVLLQNVIELNESILLV